MTTGWDSLTINVAHTETAGTNPTLIVTPAGSPACTFPLTARAALTTDSITLDSTCPIKNSQAVNGMTIQYQATGRPASTTAALDGVSLNASYYTRFPTATPAGACDNSQTGVQWMFGGDSHVYIPDATMQLYAGPSPGHPGQADYDTQQISVYGVPPTPPMIPSSNTMTGTWTTPASHVRDR